MTIEQLLNGAHEVVEIYEFWLIVFGLILMLVKLYQWAKNRKTGALVIGILVQMVLPDPEIEQRIKIIQEKKQNKNQQQENDCDLYDRLFDKNANCLDNVSTASEPEDSKK
ncbi:hypothetical protein FLL45_02275 [Aliikangiella marina]|uniref:Uncharacterized protein n=1 Tax=Aliikangiella marina TaxID=1712262 RepID=A0A545THV2_9GAMM|nr:hypothetical protein [Aliikangiella marina]TQV76804.1 hypothetical protein FLL45_02275 [Aliikangiella marina]